MITENKILNKICVPLLNDSAHLHLTLDDWELLMFSYVAIDAISLLIKSHVAVPKSAHTIFFDTRIRACHKVSKTSHILSSPFDGQKIPITEEKLKEIFQKIQEKYPEKTVIWIDEKNLIDKNYWITEQPGQDAKKDIFYASAEKCTCYTCQNFTQEYLEHLKNSGVFLALRLTILHNLFVVSNCAIMSR